MENKMLEKLRATIGTKVCSDGTTRGTVSLLGKRDFPTAASFDCYAIAFCKAIKAMEAFPKAESKADADKALAEAVKHISAAYDVLKKALAVSGGLPENLQRAEVKEKHIRGWMLCGAFARMNVNYATAERSIDMKSYKLLQKFAEMDVSDILNKRERLNIVNASKANNNFQAAVDKRAAEAKAKAEAKAAEAKAKAEAEAKAKAASPEAEAVKAEAEAVKAEAKAEAAEAKAKAKAFAIEIGAKVKHNKYGVGIIADKADKAVVIDFGESGKKLIALDAFGKFVEVIPAEAEAKPKRKASRKAKPEAVKPEAPKAEAEAK